MGTTDLEAVCGHGRRLCNFHRSPEFQRLHCGKDHLQCPPALLQCAVRSGIVSDRIHTMLPAHAIGVGKTAALAHPQEPVRQLPQRVHRLLYTELHISWMHCWRIIFKAIEALAGDSQTASLSIYLDLIISILAFRVHRRHHYAAGQSCDHIHSRSVGTARGKDLLYIPLE